MSYKKARECFAENVELVGPNPMSNPQTFNLNNGLALLTKQIDSDLSSIEKKLDAIFRVLQHR